MITHRHAGTQARRHAGTRARGHAGTQALGQALPVGPWARGPAGRPARPPARPPAGRHAPMLSGVIDCTVARRTANCNVAPAGGRGVLEGGDAGVAERVVLGLADADARGGLGLA